VEHCRRGSGGRVSRTTGNNWSRGYKTYRHGQVAGFVPALDRLAVREISGRFLSQDERIEIADLRHAGLGVRACHKAVAVIFGTGRLSSGPVSLRQTAR
jgi:hypothetical protein